MLYSSLWLVHLLIGVAVAICFLVADTLLLLLFLDGYFAVVVTRAHALRHCCFSLPLRQMLCRFDDCCL